MAVWVPKQVFGMLNSSLLCMQSMPYKPALRARQGHASIRVHGQSWPNGGPFGAMHPLAASLARPSRPPARGGCRRRPSCGWCRRGPSTAAPGTRLACRRVFSSSFRKSSQLPRAAREELSIRDVWGKSLTHFAGLVSWELDLPPLIRPWRTRWWGALREKRPASVRSRPQKIPDPGECIFWGKAPQHDRPRPHPTTKDPVRAPGPPSGA